VTLEQRKQAFYNAVVTKKWASAKQTHYGWRYLRLIFVRRNLEFLFSAILVLSGQQLLIETGFSSPLWVPVGVALSALFLRGNALLPGIFCGILLSYLTNNFSGAQALAQSFLFVTCLFSLRILGLRWIGPIAPLSRVSVLWKFLALTSVICAVHVLLFYTLLHDLPPSLSFWYRGWLGEMLGIVCLTPLCLMFDPFVPSTYFQRKTWGWWVSGGLLALAHGGLIGLSAMPALWLSLGLLIGTAVYARCWGKIPTALLLLITSVIYLGGVDFLPPNAPLLLSIFGLSAIVSLSIAISAHSSQHR